MNISLKQILDYIAFTRVNDFSTLRTSLRLNLVMQVRLAWATLALSGISYCLMDDELHMRL